MTPSSKQEFAGEYRYRSSVVVVHDSKLLVFFAIDPTSGRKYLFLPGGKIEEGEDAAHAAEREALEETGYRVQVDRTTALESHYPFTWDGKLYHSHSVFFRGTLISPFDHPAQVHDVDYNKGARWIDIDEVRDTFSYTPEIRDAILSLISKK